MFSYTKIMQGIQAVSAVVTDAYFNLVTLLLNTTTTNGAQNNTFLDSSTANSGSGWTITRNGNTTQGTFSPFSQTGWSNYFPGSSYFTRAFTSTTDGMYIQGSTYTIEAWVYPSALSGTQYIYICNASNVASYGYNALYLSGTSAAFATRVATSGTEYAISGGTVALNQWSHIAVSVSANSAKLFLNGTQVGATTTIAADTFTPTGAGIGQNQNGAAGGTTFTGYISNLRITQAGALYTSNFTPSTTPLTTTVSSGTVSFLTAQSNRFIDTSSNSYTLAITGTPSVQAFSPFAPTAAYSTTTVGGSGYFDGTGDYLQNPASASNGLGTGNYTLECWFYLNSAPASGSDRTFIRYHWTGSTGQNAVYYLSVINSAGTLYPYTFARDVTTPSNNTTITSSTAIRLSTWNHVAAVRSGTTLTLYLNGVSVGSATGVSWNLTAGTNIPIYIGTYNGSSEMMDGYISGARVVKSAVYSGSTYTIPTAPPTSDVNTQLLLNYTNAGIYDATAKNDLETVGNAQVSTTQAKFGTTSMSFDGTGDQLLLPYRPTLDLASGDWTIEGWLYLNSVSPSTQGVITLFNGNAVSQTNVQYLIRVNTSNLVFECGISTTTYSISFSGITTGTWYHFAMVRNGTTMMGFLNGTKSGTTPTLASNLNTSTTWVTSIGRYTSGGTNYDLNGYIDDLRITNGYARYTANFTAPTVTFPVQ